MGVYPTPAADCLTAANDGVFDESNIPVGLPIPQPTSTRGILASTNLGAAAPMAAPVSLVGRLEAGLSEEC
jgi:hypothetical protein